MATVVRNNEFDIIQAARTNDAFREVVLTGNK